MKKNVPQFGVLKYSKDGKISPTEGIEPSATGLKVQRSTSELNGLFYYGKAGFSQIKTKQGSVCDYLNIVKFRGAVT